MAEPLSRGIKTSVRIEGLEALRQRFRALPKAVQEKEIGNAVAKGAIVIRDAAREHAPELKAPAPNRIAGLLKSMIRSTRGVRRDSEAAAFVTVRRLSNKAIAKFKSSQAAKGLKGSAGSNPNDPFYWRFVEFGTSKMPAQSFMRKAFDTMKELAVNAIKQALSEGVERQAAKLTQGAQR